jgi:hypothetical protein
MQKRQRHCFGADGKAIDFDVRGEMLDGDEITSAFAVPRLMRLEYKLNQLCKENAPWIKFCPKSAQT